MGSFLKTGEKYGHIGMKIPVVKLRNKGILHYFQEILFGNGAHIQLYKHI